MLLSGDSCDTNSTQPSIICRHVSMVITKPAMKESADNLAEACMEGKYGLSTSCISSHYNPELVKRRNQLGFRSANWRTMSPLKRSSQVRQLCENIKLNLLYLRARGLFSQREDIHISILYYCTAPLSELGIQNDSFYQMEFLQDSKLSPGMLLPKPCHNVPFWNFGF